MSSSIFDIAFKMNFKVVVTLHDYFTACPNGGYFNYKKNEVCRLSPLSKKCIKCNCDSRNYMFKLYRVIRQFVQNKIVRLNERLENVITISEFSEKILKKTLNSKTRITRVYNPIEIIKDEQKDDIAKNKYFLYVGRISKEKGVDLFCEAITELKYEGVIVGDGDEKARLEEKYPNIKFTGWKDKRDVKKYMKNSKCLVFPSKWYETAGLTVIEAQTLGIPAIVSKNCAASEFIEEGKNGFLFENFEQLKENMMKLESQSLQVTLNNDFGIEKYLNNLKKLYGEI